MTRRRCRSERMSGQWPIVERSPSRDSGGGVNPSVCGNAGQRSSHPRSGQEIRLGSGHRYTVRLFCRGQPNPPVSQANPNHHAAPCVWLESLKER